MTTSEIRRATAQQEDDERKADALATPRHPHDESWGYPGAGCLHVQLVRRPSRGPSICYEIRGDLGALAVYRSTSRSHDDHRVLGHERLAVKPSQLYRVVRALEAVRVPVRLPYLGGGVLDGICYEVSTFGGAQTAARFCWCGDERQDEWHPLTSLALLTINRFDAASFNSDVDANAPPSSESPLAAAGELETADLELGSGVAQSAFEVTRKWRGPGGGVTLRIAHLPTGIAVERYIGYEDESPFLVALMAGLHVLINGNAGKIATALPAGDSE